MVSRSQGRHSRKATMNSLVAGSSLIGMPVVSMAESRWGGVEEFGVKVRVTEMRRSRLCMDAVPIHASPAARCQPTPPMSREMAGRRTRSVPIST